MMTIRGRSDGGDDGAAAASPTEAVGTGSADGGRGPRAIPVTMPKVAQAASPVAAMRERPAR